MRIALVLSGGNALGAYAAGAYEALHVRDCRIDLVSGASIGAVNGAIIAGNSSEQRVDKLREFWTQASMGNPGTSAAPTLAPRRLRNLGSVLQTLLFGRPGLFMPRIPGMQAMPFPGNTGSEIARFATGAASVFDHRPSVATLRRLIDFGRLNEASVPLVVTAIDAQNGRPVRFDTRRQPLAPEHLVATTAMPPLFPPIAIEGRLLADPGLVENLPLDPVLDPPLDGDLLCFAVDAYAPNDEAIDDLDTACERAQDILFAWQSRRSLHRHLERHRLQRSLASLRETTVEESGEGDVPATFERETSAARLTVVHLAYRAPAHEVAGKALDFSRTSIEERWSAGREDMERALDRLAADDGAGREDGCAFYDLT